MRHPRSLPENAEELVADASVWINLAASRRACDVLKAFSCRIVVTDIALAELERGRAKGREAADEVAALIRGGVVEVVRCRLDDEDVLLSLISGPAFETLDDGEAATLVYAHVVGALAIIDERKATALAARRFPNLSVRSTVDLLLAPQVVTSIGAVAVSEALYRALTGARMRIPDEWMNQVLDLIGPEKARLCPSLPAAHRRLAPVELGSASNRSISGKP